MGIKCKAECACVAGGALAPRLVAHRQLHFRFAKLGQALLNCPSFPSLAWPASLIELIHRMSVRVHEYD